MTHAIVWKIKYGVRFEATQKNSDNLTYFILKICIMHFQTMTTLISLIVSIANPWIMVCLFQRYYNLPMHVCRYFMRIENILFLLKKGKYKMFFTWFANILYQLKAIWCTCDLYSVTKICFYKISYWKSLTFKFLCIQQYCFLY